MTAPPSSADAQASSLPGIIACVAAMVFFSIGNAFTKLALETFSVAQVTMLRLWSLLLLAIALASLNGGLRAAAASRRPALQLARGGFLVVDQVIFSVALVYLGLAEMQALYATGPLFTMLMAGLLLGERIGWRHWLAVLIGLAGALLIVRPGSSVFHPVSALAIFGAFMYALYSICTRLASHTDTKETSLLYTSILGMIVMTPIGLWDWRTPPFPDVCWLWLAGALLFSMTAHALVIRAYAIAPASVLQPFSYILLGFATVIGFGVFGEVPDLLMIAGTALIASGGLFIAWHEARKRTGG
jgi:drug/metabolite transporter (DMT)-like permease